MFKIGWHLSASAGFLGMGKEAFEAGANTFAFFTRNPRGGQAKPIEKEDADALCDFIKEKNFHPGSHMKQGTEAGVKMITDMLNTILKPEQTTTVLLETMAGKGSEVGSRFEELKAIIDGVELKEKLGVCMDTCHVYDAGYDIKNNLDGVLEQFDKIIGLDRLKACHLNDSKNPFESHKDRHEKIGQGSLGIETFEKVINHTALSELPFILETPQESTAGYAEEIRLLRGLYRD